MAASAHRATFAWILLAGLAGAARLANAASSVPEVPDRDEQPRDPCPRPAPGSAVAEPRQLRSSGGVLRLELNIRNWRMADGSTHTCYTLPDGTVSPTLRLHPGDLLVLNLNNALSDRQLAPALVPAMQDSMPASTPASTPQRTTTSTMAGHDSMDHAMAAHAGDPDHGDPCKAAAMTATSTNLHFHGLAIPPVCHQDEVLHTAIASGAPSFEYRFRVPPDQPPGLYWYHPHVHGFSSAQVQGGASGALIIEGIESAAPELAGLPERVLVIRDQELLHPQIPDSAANAAMRTIIDRDGDAANTGTGAGKPAKDLSINFVPVPYPEYPAAQIAMKPGQRQLWRVLNASSVTYLDLAALYRRGPRFRPQWLGVVAIDGVPLAVSGRKGQAIQWRDRILLSPGARVEFILEGPAAGVPALLVTHTVDTGPGGENDPDRPLAAIVATDDAPVPVAILAAHPQPLPAPPFAWLGDIQPARVRKLYFSEDAKAAAASGGRDGFFLTVEGQTPSAFDMHSTAPNIVVHQGEVEDWIIENRSDELHAFHIHQLHFQVVDWLGLTVNEGFLRDTVNVPYYLPSMPHYPSVRLRMDFRAPGTVGTFVYHCHLLDHEDGGMMGMITVLPATDAAAAQH
jgi:FtsP/CotA-like multicopper oxidase with cupredoxin domain